MGDAPLLTMPLGVEPVRREERLWGIPAALALIRRGDVAVHAAAVEIDGRALLFAGPGRFGKTGNSRRSCFRAAERKRSLDARDRLRDAERDDLRVA